MQKRSPLIVACFVVAAGMFAAAPFLIGRAPLESTMGLIQKIFYFHVPAAIAMFTAAVICGLASGVYLAKRSPGADRLALAAGEMVVLFGLLVLVTGPIWARKAWGVWWQWDVRLTLTLVMWLTFVAYLLLRRFAGAGAEVLAAAIGVFGMADVPFVYWSVKVWRTVHPNITVTPTLPASMMVPFAWCAFAFLFLLVALLAVRVRLERARTDLEALLAFAED